MQLYNVCMHAMYVCKYVQIHTPSQIKGEEAVSAGNFHALKTYEQWWYSSINSQSLCQYVHLIRFISHPSGKHRRNISVCRRCCPFGQFRETCVWPPEGINPRSQLVLPVGQHPAVANTGQPYRIVLTDCVMFCLILFHSSPVQSILFCSVLFYIFLLTHL